MPQVEAPCDLCSWISSRMVNRAVVWLKDAGNSSVAKPSTSPAVNFLRRLLKQTYQQGIKTFVTNHMRQKITAKHTGKKSTSCKSSPSTTLPGLGPIASTSPLAPDGYATAREISRLLA